jgi:multicomponent Na+:H+ antiporter subunit D
MLFSQSYVKKNKSQYYALMCLLLAGLLGIIHTGDIFNMFVFFEIMSISSYGLVAFYRNRKALEASIKYIVMGALATSLILLGITFLYGAFGTLNMADIAVKASGYTGILLPLSIAFLLTGFSLKSGLVPFHTWLPDAHPAAPSPISALLSGLVIKGGIYCIMRVGFTVLGAPAILLQALTVIGVLSMVVGGALALVQTDLRGCWPIRASARWAT